MGQQLTLPTFIFLCLYLLFSSFYCFLILPHPLPQLLSAGEGNEMSGKDRESEWEIEMMDGGWGWVSWQRRKGATILHPMALSHYSFLSLPSCIPSSLMLPGLQAMEWQTSESGYRGLEWSDVCESPLRSVSLPFVSLVSFPFLCLGKIWQGLTKEQERDDS